MEINKILLSSLNALNEIQTFSSQKESVQKENTSALYEEEDTSFEIIQKEVSCYNLKSITSNNSDEILKNSNGKKTFIIVGNKKEDGSSCGRCDSASTKIQEAVGEMNGEANFVELNYNENKDLFNQLTKDVEPDKLMGFPAVIVCDEDGNPEKIFSNIYDIAKNSTNKTGLSELLRSALGTSNFDQQIPQEGTTFVYAHSGNGGSSKFNEISGALGNQASFLEINTAGDYAMDRIISNTVKDAGLGNGYESRILKFVDGKLVDFIPAADYLNQNSKIETSVIIDYFENKIDGKENIEKLTSDNVSTYLRGTEGTSYVVVGNPTGCPKCITLAPYLNEVAGNIGNDANFLDLAYSQNKDLYNQLKNEAGYDGNASFPLIIKCVDGKATEFISLSDYLYSGGAVKSTDTIVDDITTKLENKIEGTYKENPNKNTQNKTLSSDNKNMTEKTQNVKNKDNIELEQEKQEKNILKQKLNSLKQNLEVINEVRKEITTDALENAISNATSISDLKDVISIYASNLDFELQINLSSVVNEFNSNDDVDSAKEQLLEML